VVNSRIRTPFYIFFLNPVYFAANFACFNWKQVGSFIHFDKLVKIAIWHLLSRKNEANLLVALQINTFWLGCRALASHQCGSGSIPRSGVKCGWSLLVLYSAPRGFLRVLQFPLSSKNQHLTWLCQLLISSANENNPIDICTL